MAAPRVLLVVGDADLAAMLHEVLQPGLKARSEIAGSATEALEMLATDADFAAVVVDESLPDQPPGALLASIGHAWPGLGRVFLTSHRPEGLPPATLAAAEVVLCKPFDGEALRAAVRAVARRGGQAPKRERIDPSYSGK
jgi:DNA-binding response OmpR family regulator